jgi:Do/DeqQ family serine protease
MMHPTRRTTALFLSVVLVVPLMVRAQAPDPLTSEHMLSLARTNRQVARMALPAVVHIVTDPSSFQFGQGSGVIVNGKEGIILTNNHVVANAQVIEVRLHNGKRHDAHLIGTDPPTDLAVIGIDATGLAELVIGDSDALEVGDLVMTVGNPFGLAGTVSQGIVSAKDRYTPFDILDYEGFIQTDAVINPGNSGGPLVNMLGQIVGINTAIETDSGQFAGVGFAVPSSKIHQVLPTLMRGERVQRGYLGIGIASAADRSGSEWKESYGVLVTSVEAGEPAAKAGLRPGDIVVNLAGAPMRDHNHLRETVAAMPPGKIVVVDLWRDGNLVSLQVELAERRPPEVGRVMPPEDSTDILGMTLRTLTEALARRYDLPTPPEAGVLVTRVDPDGPAAKLDIEVGDVIVSVNDVPVSAVDHVESAVELLAKLSLEVDRPEDMQIILKIAEPRGDREVRVPLSGD